MNLTQIRSRDVIPWIFFKRKSMTENGSASDEFFQVPVEALLKVDKLTEYDDKKVHSDSLICFLNQLQFVRLKERNNLLKTPKVVAATTVVLMTSCYQYGNDADTRL